MQIKVILYFPLCSLMRVHGSKRVFAAGDCCVVHPDGGQPMKSRSVMYANLGSIVASNNIEAFVRGEGNLLGFPKDFPVMGMVTLGARDGAFRYSPWLLMFVPNWIILLVQGWDTCPSGRRS